MIQNNKTLITEIEWCKKPVISDLFSTDTFNKDAMVLRNGLFLYYYFFLMSGIVGWMTNCYVKYG